MKKWNYQIIKYVYFFHKNAKTTFECRVYVKFSFFFKCIVLKVTQIPAKIKL